MSTESIVNVINAGHDAIYSAFLHILQDSPKTQNIRETLTTSPNVFAAARRPKVRTPVANWHIPPKVDVVVNLKGVGAFSHGAKSCIAKDKFAISLLDFLLRHKEDFDLTNENFNATSELSLFIN